jgi:hypothetical protein
MQSPDSFYNFLIKLSPSTIIAFVKEHKGMTERMKIVYQVRWAKYFIAIKLKLFFFARKLKIQVAPT